MKFSDNLTKNIRDLLQIPGLRQTTSASDKIGLPPGALVHVGEQKVDNTTIRLIDYDQDQLKDIRVESIGECLQYMKSSSVTWIEVYGLHDIEVIEKLGVEFGLHPLVMEDILNTNQRPKFEEYDDYLFIALKNLKYDQENEMVVTEHVSIVLGQGYVVAFHETDDMIFKPVLNRLQNSRLRIRKRGTDYLAYALIDTIVDHYFVMMEVLGERLEELDIAVMQKLDRDNLETLFHLKKSFLSIRKSIFPLQDIISDVLDEEYSLITEPTLLFYRDVKDHIHQVIDSLEMYREMASNAVDTHLSIQSMRMNEVMKVLTIAATIFMPLTFVAGIYGMNFKFMPELEWRWGYFSVLGGMGLMIIALVIYFRRKKWL